MKIKSKQKPIGITWSPHRRTSELCKAIQIPLIEISPRTGSRLIRYFVSTFRTVQILIRHRPNAVLAQSPSLALVLLLIFLKPTFKFKLIVDAHNESVVPYINTGARLLEGITRFCLRHADITIVTNQFLGRRVTEEGGSPIVLPDAIPTIARDAFCGSDTENRIAVICTSAPDEPIENIVLAAQQVPRDYRLEFSGKESAFRSRISGDLPANVKLTGYLNDYDYWRWLSTSAAIMDLTDMDDCLVCGLYEALAVEIPMILTKNRATDELFPQGCILIDNSVQEIAAAINFALSNMESLRVSAKALRSDYERNWQHLAVKLLHELDAANSEAST